MFSRQQAAALMKIKGDVEAGGAAIVTIGSGTPEQARKFSENFNFEGELYVDPSLNTYEAFGLSRGFLKTLGPSSLARGFRAIRQGFRQGGSAGDLWQQGGVFVIAPGGKILFAHRDSGAGDHADTAELLNACPMKGG